jgi:competence protein ComEA
MSDPQPADPDDPVGPVGPTDRVDLLDRPGLGDQTSPSVLRALALRLGVELRPAALVGVVVVAVGVVAAGWFVLRTPPAPATESLIPLVSTTTDGSPATATTTRSEVVVHAAGAVARPGVYRLGAGARVADLVEAAGGLVADADADRVNLAAPLVDGQQLYVPRHGETVTPAPPASAPSDATRGLVDLNTADVAELETLPGIGPATAQAIVDYRAEVGRFSSIDELLDVPGIGEAKLAQIYDLVTV